MVSVAIFIITSSYGFAFNDDSNKKFANLLLNEFREHPEATIQDFYKFIHQLSMGPGHWKMDFDMAREYLNAEIRTLNKDSTQRLCQFLSPDGGLIRINLRPYIAMNGDIDSLAEAFVKTSNEFIQSEKILKVNLNLFSQMVKDRKIPFNTDSVQSYIHRMEEKHYPAVHHSRIYEEKYLPSYRVVYRKYLPVNIYNATHKN
jgi:hypothetical protein